MAISMINRLLSGSCCSHNSNIAVSKSRSNANAEAVDILPHELGNSSHNAANSSPPSGGGVGYNYQHPCSHLLQTGQRSYSALSQPPKVCSLLRHRWHPYLGAQHFTAQAGSTLAESLARARRRVGCWVVVS
jgi:hypothetical protein